MSVLCSVQIVKGSERLLLFGKIGAPKLHFLRIYLERVDQKSIRCVKRGRG